MQSDQLKGGLKRFPEDIEMATDALDASCIVGAKKEESTTTKGQIHDGTKGQYN